MWSLGLPIRFQPSWCSCSSTGSCRPAGGRAASGGLGMASPGRARHRSWAVWSTNYLFGNMLVKSRRGLPARKPSRLALVVLGLHLVELRRLVGVVFSGNATGRRTWDSTRSLTRDQRRTPTRCEASPIRSRHAQAIRTVGGEPHRAGHGRELLLHQVPARTRSTRGCPLS